MRSWLDETCNLAGMIAEAKIELRKKYYDGNMVREAVMSVTDDYNTIMKLLSAFADQPPLTDVIEVVRCGKCRHYQGNHDVPGCAPCDFWGLGAVMWDDYCRRGEAEVKEIEE